MELYIIRHGQTDYNKAGIIQGRKINAPLNEYGRKQALAFHVHYGKEKFDHILTSSLIRTQQTVNPFVVNGYSFQSFADIDEIDWGNQEGLKSNPELKNRYQEMLQEWQSGNLRKAMPGGESPLDIQKRVLRFKDEVLSGLSGKVLICSHGRTMRVLLCTFLNVDLHKMDQFPHENLSLYKLEWNNGHFELLNKNETSHLQKLKV